MEDFIPTRVSRLKDEAVKDFVSVKYEAPKKKSKDSASKTDKFGSQHSVSDSKGNKEEKNAELKRQQEVEMKRARYDVMKFGMSGFQKVQAKKAKVALAISLGAIPPKNCKVNYKTLKSQRKYKKEKEGNEKFTSGLTNSMLKHKAKKTRKKDSDGILGVYGKVEKNVLSRKKS